MRIHVRILGSKTQAQAVPGLPGVSASVGESWGVLESGICAGVLRFSPPVIFPTLSCFYCLMSSAGSIQHAVLPVLPLSGSRRSLSAPQFLKEDSDWHSSPVKPSHTVPTLVPVAVAGVRRGFRPRSGSRGWGMVTLPLGSQTPSLLRPQAHRIPDSFLGVRIPPLLSARLWGL